MPVLYRGERHGPAFTDEVEVFAMRQLPGGIRETDLLPHVVRHSPDGFNWGYPGSGPADLALSILTHYLGHEPEPAIYQRFKDDYVGRWPIDRWQLDSETLAHWCLRHNVERKRAAEPMGISHLRRILEHYPDVTYHPAQESTIDIRGSNGDLIEPSGTFRPAFLSPAGATIPSLPILDARQWLEGWDAGMRSEVSVPVGLLMRTLTSLEGLRGCLVDPCSECGERVLEASTFSVPAEQQEATAIEELCTACRSVHDRASEALQDLRLIQLAQPRPER